MATSYAMKILKIKKGNVTLKEKKISFNNREKFSTKTFAFMSLISFKSKFIPQNLVLTLKVCLLNDFIKWKLRIDR